MTDPASAGDALAAFLAARVRPEHRAIVLRIVADFAAVAPDVTLRMRGGTEKYIPVPVFRLTRDIAAISPSRSAVTLSFTAGASFDDPFHRLGGAGKMSRTIRITRIEDYPSAAVAHYMRQAVAADRAR